MIQAFKCSNEHLSGHLVVQDLERQSFRCVAGPVRALRIVDIAWGPIHLSATSMTYEYVCEACGHQWEAEQSIKDRPLEDCVSCRAKKAKRLVSGGTGFLLKGGGWYADLYGSPGAAKTSDDKNAKAAAKSDSAETKSSDAKTTSGDGKAAAASSGSGSSASGSSASNSGSTSSSSTSSSSGGSGSSSSASTGNAKAS